MRTAHHTMRIAALCLAISATPLCAQVINEINLTTNDIAYDAVSGKIYASIPGSVGANGNSIAVINPGTLTVGPYVAVGSEPGPIAISDDGQYLYVSLDGAASVRRVDVPTLTADIQFLLGNDPFFGPLYAEDLEVQPGSNDTLAVSTKRLGVSPRHGGVAVYVDGVQLPAMTASHTGANRIEFSGNPSILYGYNNETTSFGFFDIMVDATGATTSMSRSTAIVGFGVDIHYHQGVVYATNGAAIDPQTGASLGTFPGAGSSASVVADAALDRVYFLRGNTIQVYRASNFTLVENINVPAARGTGGSLTRFGRDGLAFRTSANQVFLITPSPIRLMDITPRAGDYLASQNFDLAIIVSTPGTSVARLANATIDGVDITAAMQERLIAGSLASGEETLRFPGFGAADSLGAGTHTLDITIDLADGSTVSDSVTWNMLPVIE